MCKIVKVSVIICTYNRSEDLYKALDAITKQKLDVEFEILVVDDGSTDRTREVAERFGTKYLYNTNKKGIGYVRDLGWRNTSGDLVIYIDDDCIPEENWLQTMKDVYLDPEVVAAGGYVTGQRTDSLVSAYMTATGYGNPYVDPMALDGFSFFKKLFLYGKNYYKTRIGVKQASHPLPVEVTYGANCSFLRSAMEKVGGYNISFTSSEDTDISQRIIQEFPDKKVVLETRAVVRHKHHTSFKVLSRMRYDRAEDIYNVIQDNELDPLRHYAPVFILLFIAATSLFSPLSLLLMPVVFYTAYFWWIVEFLKNGNKYYLTFPFVEFVMDGIYFFRVFQIRMKRLLKRLSK